MILKKLTIVIGLRKKSLRRADSFYMMRSNISIGFVRKLVLLQFLTFMLRNGMLLFFFHLNWNC